MIDFSKSGDVGPALHRVCCDPGSIWEKAAALAVDAAPDDSNIPDPAARWPLDAMRSGRYGAVSPRVVRLRDGNYRLYYTQILPRPGYPDGAVDYDQATSRILSAVSPDGLHWTPEPGVRLSAEQGGAGEYRVVSSEVVPIADRNGHWRMYYECCRGPQSIGNAILSARSEDDGITWTVEPGVRWGNDRSNFAAPRIQSLDGGRMRLYCYERGNGIISAVSKGGGLIFDEEPGLRIAQDGSGDSHAAFAPEIMQIQNGNLVMFYAGYSASNRAQILRATSKDGLNWQKEAHPAIEPDGTGWDAVKCSEMALIPLPDELETTLRFRMLYEACDGTAPGERGVWRIAAASADIRKGLAAEAIR